MHINLPGTRNSQSAGTARIAVIGCCGFNFLKRVFPEITQIDAQLIVGYDRVGQPGPPGKLPFDCVLVHDDDELAERLRQQRPEVVLIETPDPTHATLIRIALQSGARVVLCEKPLATSQAEADALAEFCQRREPDQQVRIIDHYSNIGLVKTLFTGAHDTTGVPIRLQVVLFEQQGIPENQVASHATGMANFIHHCLAVAGNLLGLQELEVVDAVWAKHPDSPVPDTYRGLALRSHQRPELSVLGCVGKYIARPWKQIALEGSHGTATLDRDGNQLTMIGRENYMMTAHSTADTGYLGIAESLISARPLPAFLTIDDARQVVRLMEQAHAMAVQLVDYPDGSVGIFGRGAGSSRKQAA